MYFAELTLENIRCFGPKQTLKLTDADGKPAMWTVILGENGTGKTTLLQALVRNKVYSSFLSLVGVEELEKEFIKRQKEQRKPFLSHLTPIYKNNLEKYGNFGINSTNILSNLYLKHCSYKDKQLSSTVFYVDAETKELLSFFLTIDGKGFPREYDLNDIRAILRIGSDTWRNRLAALPKATRSMQDRLR